MLSGQSSTYTDTIYYFEAPRENPTPLVWTDVVATKSFILPTMLRNPNWPQQLYSTRTSTK